MMMGPMILGLRWGTFPLSPHWGPLYFQGWVRPGKWQEVAGYRVPEKGLGDVPIPVKGWTWDWQR